MSKKIIPFRRRRTQGRRGFRLFRWMWGAVGVFAVVCVYIALGGDLNDMKAWTQKLSQGTTQTRESAPAVTFSGMADVRDGDTVVINGVRVRLEGIDAFELSQICGGLACGALATRELERLSDSGPLTCRDMGQDQYDRTLAICRNAQGVDVNEAMVLSGYALAYTHYTQRYAGAQARARVERRGAWAYEFVEPYEYRRSH